MYTLKIDEDNNVITTVYETIMQRSNLVDNFQVLVSKTYKSVDMSGFTVTMRYLLPVSKKYKTFTLKLANSDYNGYLQYVVDGTTLFTSEPGDIKVSFSFVKINQLDNGTFQQLVRKTKEGIVTITAIPEWGDIVPDEALDALDQRLIALEILVKQLDALNQETYNNLVRDLHLDISAKELYLISQTGKIGNGIDIDDLSQIVGEYIAGKDLDGVQDGVTHLDDIQNLSNITVTNLDEIIK